MKYSFVIPTYNNKELLKNTLEALNYQNGFGPDDYEVIVVDDGSSDGTNDFILGINKNYELKYDYLDRGVDSCRARTRNHGWKNSSGEYVIFIDSDIIVKRNYLSELERCFSLSRDIMVIGNRLMLDQDVSFSTIQTGEVFLNYCFDSQNFDRLDFRYFLYEISSYNSNAIMCPWMQVYSCNLAVPKYWLEMVGGFDENFKEWGMEDLELGYSIYKNNVKIIINSRLEVLHQYHGERSDLIIKKDKLEGYEKNIDYFISKHPEALKMERKFVHRMLKGELSVDKMLFEMPASEMRLDYMDKEKDQSFKSLLETVLTRNDSRVIISDYLEDTDLDVWIQLKNSTGVKYYPASKRINQKNMLNYLIAERERQKIRA